MTVSLFRPGPWNLQLGTQESWILAAFPEGDRRQAWLGLFTLYLAPAASGHPALSQSFYSPFVLAVMGAGDLGRRPLAEEGLEILVADPPQCSLPKGSPVTLALPVPLVAGYSKDF